MTGKLEQVTQKIINILKADSELSSIQFFFGPPLTRKTPFIYVSWMGGPVSQVTIKAQRWRHRWQIIVVDSSKTDDVAEKSVMEKIQRIYEVLKGNFTLDGVVANSRPVEMVGETVTIGTEWAKPTMILAGARLVLECDLEWG